VADDIQTRRRGAIKVRADWLAAAPAYRLAEEIREYWKDRGAEVSVSVLELIDNRFSGAPVFCIRSNLVGGLPRGWAAARVIGKQNGSVDATLVG